METKLEKLYINKSYISTDDVLTLQDVLCELDRVLVDQKASHWRLPTRNEFLKIFADSPEELTNHIGCLKLFVTDEEHSTKNVYVMAVDKFDNMPHTYNADAVDMIMLVKEVLVKDDDSKRQLYVRNATDRITSLMKEHNASSLDLWFYSNNNVEIPNEMIRLDENDDDVFTSLKVAGDVVYVTDMRFSLNYALNEMSNECILEILSMVEDIFNKIDSGKLELREYWD